MVDLTTMGTRQEMGDLAHRLLRELRPSSSVNVVAEGGADVVQVAPRAKLDDASGALGNTTSTVATVAGVALAASAPWRTRTVRSFEKSQARETQTALLQACLFFRHLPFLQE